MQKQMMVMFQDSPPSGDHRICQTCNDMIQRKGGFGVWITVEGVDEEGRVEIVDGYFVCKGYIGTIQVLESDQNFEMD